MRGFLTRRDRLTLEVQRPGHPRPFQVQLPWNADGPRPPSELRLLTLAGLGALLLVLLLIFGPGARLTVIADAGHLPTLEQPAATSAAMANWLA